MPLTPAERQKNYREKLKNNNPVKFNEQRKKNNERTLRQYRKKQASYTEEQKEELRRNRREAKKNETLTPQEAAEPPCPSPSGSNITVHQIDRSMQRRCEYKYHNDVKNLRKTLNSVIKGFRTLQKKVQIQKKIIERMDRHYETIMIKLKDKELNETSAPHNKQTSEFTPTKSVATFLNETIPNVETPKKEEIKKRLIAYDVLKESFKSEYKNSTNTDKNIIKRIVNNDIIKKYKQSTEWNNSLGIRMGIYEARKKRGKKEHELQKKIISFYNRDDVSRITAGKKEYRTYKKVKCQKRYLLDSLKRLHRKYVAEEGALSFSTFKKYRPFYVLPPNIKDCDTCACIKHSNMQFIVDELKSIGLLQSNNLNDLVSDLVCNFKSKNCMYDDCTECCTKIIDAGDKDPEKEVVWSVWALKEYEYGKDENIKKSKKMMKIKKEGTLKELLEIFNNNINAFKKHVFNFYFQYDQYKTCIKNLKNEEVMIHIDFSENYTCKHNKEVQATHFVKDQITLHTGVLYLKHEKPISFCSISPDNQHNPESIWAHLDPVLSFVKNAHPNINVIHFFSDGPTTQYRQKKNFYLFSQNIYDYGFNYATWSFFEAAHGKGAADGVGGAIKRTLDLKIAQGQDIPDAQAAYYALLSTDTTIKIFYVPAEEIKPLDALVVGKLTAIPGTMKIHQLTTCEKYKLMYRDLSCFCKDASGNCECHSPVYHDFTTSMSNKNNTQRNRKRQNSRDTNKNDREKSHLKKAKRHHRNSSSSTEEDTNTHVEYAESDASGFLSDISMSSDVNSDENMQYELDENTGILRPRVDPNKKVNILSAVIIQPAIQNSNDVSKAYTQTSLTKHGMQTSIQDRKITGIDELSIEDGKIVTPLSEIRNSAENMAYFDLSTCNIFNEERKITVTEKENYVDYQKKNNDEKLTLLAERGENMKPETDCIMKKDGRLSDFETIDIEKTNIFEHEKSSTSIEKEETKITKTLSDCTIKKDGKLGMTDEVAKEKTDTLDECKKNKNETLRSLTDLKNCLMTEDGKQTETDKKETEKTITSDDRQREEDDLEETAREFDFKIDETVVVRYYQRKQWKYYIGFITQILDKHDDAQYKIRFLKTVKNPDLKFVVTKKLDIDVVPRNSVVKRVNLILQNAKEYFLEDDGDNGYF